MRIQKISFTSQNRYKNNNNKRRNTFEVKTESPLKEGLNTAGAWFAFGVGLDYVSKKMGNFSKSPVKNSIIINGLISAAAGAFVGTKMFLHKNNN